MSAEGKARIAAAQKKRWAAQKATPAKHLSKTASPRLTGKVAPKTAKKSAGAGKRVGSTQGMKVPAKRPTAVAKKGAAKKTVARKMTRPASKRPAKQVAAPTPEPQTTE